MHWSIPYPAEKHHHWGPETATLNWCEEDYYFTRYCAEIVNSVTNAVFVWLAVKGLRNCWTERHDVIFAVTFAGYLCVGVGSFLFHATLWYSMQLVDELSMIYTTCLMAWASLSNGKPPAIATLYGLLLSALALSITFIYHSLGDPTFHQNAYALLTALLLFRSWYLMESRLRRTRPHDVNTMWWMVGWGLFVFLCGFALWNVDNAWCGSLRGWRRGVGLPWGVLAEGHGWWHLLTGVGAYYYIVYGIWLRHCLNGDQDQFDLDWPNLWNLPVIRRKRGAANGAAVVKKKKKA
ncbi:uncharacterized protein H6S33_007336 [Morchella sextelata]|uniref:uncharacterized protein n=1 Tax=Morchella sextelata TaxID=1174677 RepID=UPI001D04F923|nr:uncharacterized protein H6S33_007336 [Morchella sextelata]KAH0603677.1 hypothetical protein H6S33_007336 [Morchella sextelata]